ncbi:MAG: archease [Bacteroidia bacterium]|nr:archease [Bacteroidia bacterium]
MFKHLLYFDRSNVVALMKVDRMIVRFEELDHTADSGIRAFGRDQAELFVNAAQGMMSLIFSGMIDVSPGLRTDFHITGDSIESLLREWLSEVLFIHNVKHVYPVSYRVNSCSPTHFRASVYSLPMSDDMRIGATELKAVTWHGLRVHGSPARMEAEVIFDT